jgi:hypothetical protein
VNTDVNPKSIPIDHQGTTLFKGAAMTMTNASLSARGRRIKFTPQVIEKIKEFVAEGISRDENRSRQPVPRLQPSSQ